MSDSALMTTVQSNGDVVVYCVQGDSGSYKIERVHSCQVQSDGLCLSLDWNCRIQKWCVYCMFSCACGCIEVLWCVHVDALKCCGVCMWMH